VIIIRSNISVDKNVLDDYPNLKFIARVWVGLDKIDLNECKNRNIKVLNTPWMNADSVADLVLAWALNMARNLNKWFEWIENRFEYMGYEFWQKSVWIIWFWNIWKKVYDRFKAFWVKKFFIFDPFLSKEDVEKNKYCEYLNNKDKIFKNSDIITFHIPLLESTKDFLWKKEIKLLKSDVLIINTSRWWIINEKVLIHFLKENPNSRFFADVWEEEPNDPKIELLNLENVLITPHIWAMTKQAEEKMHFFKDLI
jgi:D-3-phosphoglycerate dehydrogenase